MTNLDRINVFSRNEASQNRRRLQAALPLLPTCLTVANLTESTIEESTLEIIKLPHNVRCAVYGTLAKHGPLEVRSS